MRESVHQKLRQDQSWCHFLLIMLSLLLDRLDGVKYESGKINVINKKTGNKPKFYQKKWWVYMSIYELL